MKLSLFSLFCVLFAVTTNLFAVPDSVKTVTENISVVVDSVEIQETLLTVKYTITNLSDQGYNIDRKSLERPILVFQGNVEGKGYIKTGGSRGSTGRQPTEYVLLQPKERIHHSFQTKLSSYPVLENIEQTGDLTLQIRLTDIISVSDEGKTIFVTLLSKPISNFLSAEDFR